MKAVRSAETQYSVLRVGVGRGLTDTAKTYTFGLGFGRVSGSAGAP
jgi:hypothetical protein